ncbi:DUF4232 domain-containing protein [Rhodoligotrophos ferricapiens]|uniref:DUF4232 domain-containing protein n=1 Tax=Rhodoligotrophos ferricapiens TaxID=3069264 RepID=UPI00315DAEF0
MRAHWSVLTFAALIVLSANAWDEAQAQPCSGLNLKIDSEGQDATNGANAFAYKITNIGAKSCTLDGHPRVELLDTKGQPISDMAIEPSDEAAGQEAERKTPVTMNPGDEAFFAIEFPTGRHTDDCRNAVELRATLPGTEMPATFPGSFTACGPVKVSPISADAQPLR